MHVSKIRIEKDARQADWNFRVEALGAIPTIEDVEAVMRDAPDVTHPKALMLQGWLEGARTERMRQQLQ